MSWGLTIPLTGLGLAQHRELVRALPGWGYTDAWSMEVAGTDAFTPLALAGAWEDSLRLGTAIVPVFTRGPALIAQTAATLAAAAPGRFSLGLGASSPAIVQQWNGIDYADAYRRSRDVLRFVRTALAGQVVDGAFDTFSISRFRLENPPPAPVPILLAALRPGMLALSGREADGVVLNWLAATDVPRCLAEVANPAATVVARIFVCPTEDAGYARTLAKRMIAAYLTVHAYAEFHRWLGRGAALGELWRLWAAGDRKAAVAAVPDEVADALVLHGSPEQCRRQVHAYVAAGVQVPVLALLPTPEPAGRGGPAGLEAVAATLAELGPGRATGSNPTVEGENSP